MKVSTESIKIHDQWEVKHREASIEVACDMDGESYIFTATVAVRETTGGEIDREYRQDDVEWNDELDPELLDACNQAVCDALAKEGYELR